MGLQDDYFELRSSLKGNDLKRLNRIWSAFCEVESDAEEARECVGLINRARRLLVDKDPLSITRGERKQ